MITMTTENLYLVPRCSILTLVQHPIHTYECSCVSWSHSL